MGGPTVPMLMADSS